MSDKSASNFWSSIKKNISKQRQQAPIEPVKDQNVVIPLSYNQEQLWQLDKLNPNSVHNIANALKFELELDFTALEASLREIVRRHSILRTVFPVVNNKPVQKVISETNFNLPIVNLQEVPQVEQEAQAKQIAVAEKQKPFDLVNEPGFRAKVVRLAEAKYILLLTVHHIIFDGVSFGIFFKELKTLYAAFSQNNFNPLPELPIQYTDFAYWQRQLLASSKNNHLLVYWQARFAEGVESLKLPQDNFVNTAFNYEGKSVKFKLSPKLSKKVKTFSSTQKVTLFTTLLTTFKILLFCYTQQIDIMLVSPEAGRDRPETKDLIGYFNNMLVLRSNLDRHSTFLATLGLVDRTITEAREHQFPFKKITELPSLAAISLSRAMFSLSNYNTKAPELSAIKPTFLDLSDADAEKSNFDLSLSMYDRGTQLTGIIKYKTALFSEATVKQIIANYQSLLEKLLDSPQVVLNSLPVLNQKKRSPSNIQFDILNQPGKINQLEYNSIWDNIEPTCKQTIEDIEGFISQHPTIKRVIIVPQKNHPNHFIIYILPLFETTVNQQDLNTKLKQKYSDDADLFNIVILKNIPLNEERQLDLLGMTSLPLTIEGNVCVEAIPVANWGLVGGEELLFHPQNIVQEIIAQIWAEVLGLETYVRGASKFNIHDNFFELGGHSLATIKLIDRIEQNFQVELSITDLFECATINSLEARINSLKQQHQQSNNNQNWSHIVPIKTGGDKQPFFLIPGGGGGERTLMIYGQLLFLLGKEQPVYGLRTHSANGGGWAVEKVHDSVEKLAAAYVTEICQLQTKGNYIIAGECVGGIVAFEVAQQLLRKGCQVSLLLIDTLCPKGIKNLYSAKIDLLQENTAQNESLSLLTRKAREYYAEIVGKYQPDIYPAKITMLISENRVSKKLALNWQHLAQNGCDIYEVPGDHDSYLGKLVQTTAQQLTACLATLQHKDSDFAIAEGFSAKLLTSEVNLNPREQRQHSDIISNQDNYINVWHCLDDLERRAGIYELALANYADLAFVYTLIGRNHARQQEFEQARYYYQKAISHDPYNIGAYLALGDSFLFQKEFEPAIKAYEQGRKLDPSSPWLYISLGKYYSEIGNSNRAIAIYQKALLLAPDNLTIYASLGNLQADLGLIEAGFNTFNSALEIDPDNTHLNLCMAHLHRKNSNYEAAINAFKKALISQPNNINTYINLGTSLTKAGRVAEAKQVFFDAINLNPDLPNLYNQLANLQRQTEEYEAAVVSFRHSLELDPRQINVYKALAYTLNLLNRSTTAISVLEQAIAFNPKNASLYKLLGDIQRQHKRHEAAINSYYHSLELEPNQFGVYYALGASLNQVSRLPEAIEACKAAIEQDPNHAGVYIALGNAQLKLKNLDLAIASYQKAIELNPQQPFVVYQNLGNMLSRAAIAAYQKALELQPDNEGVQSSLKKLTQRN